jgi:hypothetical protein
VRVPQAIVTVLSGISVDGLPGENAVGGLCEGAKFHSPQVLRLHRVDIGIGREVLLCGTCRDNVAVLMLLERTGRDDVPWRRGFGNQLRALVTNEEDTTGA